MVSKSFLNRSKGLKKKTYELSTLCGVDALMIAYEGEGSEEPHIWPEDPKEIERIINRYKGLNEDDRSGKRRKLDVSGFLSDVKMAIDDQMDGFSNAQLQEVLAALESKLALVRSMKEEVNAKKQEKSVRLKQTELGTETLKLVYESHPIHHHHHHLLSDENPVRTATMTDLHPSDISTQDPLAMILMQDLQLYRGLAF
ncbi:PREDICTED: agamous-like MADS-box protein AGL82 [Nelumbo nucifera]|uniref:Agamous-like MADS-box protein AGL82 n=2 Tax=Nelumbo nucifera TaxID=4432 RepID=A0A1U7ZIR6_NELNU|nr:PREDICTED: agamous-like MADS-box protein AGL82 [Nelumbo nucifera]DAD43333.1 TPA_asm: hypothetical protein HUJ06_001563 [Nelumbo nucifera]